MYSKFVASSTTCRSPSSLARNRGGWSNERSLSRIDGIRTDRFQELPPSHKSYHKTTDESRLRCRFHRSTFQIRRTASTDSSAISASRRLFRCKAYSAPPQTEGHRSHSQEYRPALDADRGAPYCSNCKIPSRDGRESSPAQAKRCKSLCPAVSTRKNDSCPYPQAGRRRPAAKVSRRRAAVQ